MKSDSKLSDYIWAHPATYHSTPSKLTQLIQLDAQLNTHGLHPSETKTNL